ncbi:MAG: hypothetical protein ACLTOV_00425 [Phocaeicola sp.]
MVPSAFSSSQLVHQQLRLQQMSGVVLGVTLTGGASSKSAVTDALRTSQAKRVGVDVVIVG